MSDDPWIGDATTKETSGCGFGGSGPGDGPKCTDPATVHVMSESAIHGVVSLSACDRHAPIARAAGPLIDEHPFGPGCDSQPSYWTPSGYCLPIAPEQAS